jgi:hypothetical protein
VFLTIAISTALGILAERIIEAQRECDTGEMDEWEAYQDVLDWMVELGLCAASQIPEAP